MNATATNITLKTMGGAAAQGPWFTATFVPTLINRVADLVAAPFLYPQMVYILTPMLITLVLMEFYFGRYKDEELGWNTAVGHALVLIFVGIDLLKTVYPSVTPSTMATHVWMDLGRFSSGETISTIIAIAVLTYGFFLLIMDFFHWLPKGLAFFVSGTLQVDLLAYLAIVLVYTNNARVHPIALDGYTFLAAILLFLGLWGIFGFIHVLEPEKKDKRDWELLAKKRRQIMANDEEARTARPLADVSNDEVVAAGETESTVIVPVGEISALKERAPSPKK